MLTQSKHSVHLISHRVVYRATSHLWQKIKLPRSVTLHLLHILPTSLQYFNLKINNNVCMHCNVSGIILSLCRFLQVAVTINLTLMLNFKLQKSSLIIITVQLKGNLMHAGR